MSNYSRVSAPTDLRRPFAVTVGLRAGYGEDAVTRTVADAVSAALDWMKHRAASGREYLTGTVSEGRVVYAWPEGEGKAAGGFEPTAVFSGEVSVLYNADLADEEVERMLDDLAAHLGRELEQTRVYVAYCDKTWVLQADEAETPTGD